MIGHCCMDGDPHTEECSGAVRYRTLWSVVAGEMMEGGDFCDMHWEFAINSIIQFESFTPKRRGRR